MVGPEQPLTFPKNFNEKGTAGVLPAQVKIRAGEIEHRGQRSRDLQNLKALVNPRRLVRRLMQTSPTFPAKQSECDRSERVVQ